jgi:hypothetical protein
MATHYGMTCYDLIHSLCLTPSLYSPRILLFLKALGVSERLCLRSSFHFPLLPAKLTIRYFSFEMRTYIH